MTRNATCTVVGLALTAGLAQALVSAYKVEPVCAAWSGKVKYDVGVGQQVCCNFDSVVYCELFVGDYNDTGAYKVDVYEVGGPEDPVAWNSGVPPERPHAWLKMSLTTESGYKFTKGKTYSFKFLRASGSDSVHYYTALGSTYPYGSMSVGGQEA